MDSTIPLIVRMWRLRQRKLKVSKFKSSPSSNSDPAMAVVSLEHKAVYILAITIALYWFTTQLIAFISMGLWFQLSTAGSNVMTLNNINPWWFSLFHTISAFNNAGFGLLSDSLIQVNAQILPLIFMGGLIMFGYPFYPVFLRGILFVSHSIASRLNSPLALPFRYILENPRNYITHLFPRHPTWILCSILVFLTALQTVLLASLDHNTPAFDGLNAGYVTANSFFQSISVRMCGLNSINIAALRVESLVLMIGYMYISAYPITILLRSTNKSSSLPEEEKATSFQLRRLLMQDLLWIMVPWYFICAIEGYTSFSDGFTCLFEVVSAYGTIGLSLGLSYAPYSFSGSFSIPSKLAIILLMTIGRHRGMPDNIDAAIPLNFAGSSSRPLEVRSRRRSSIS